LAQNVQYFIGYSPFQKRRNNALPKNRQLLQILDDIQGKDLFIQIKITNTGLFSIIPGKGFLKEGETSSITIKVNRIGDYNAKILISYAQL
jgi:hypothetical protein